MSFPPFRAAWVAFFALMLALAQTGFSQCISFSEWQQVVPGENLPAEVKLLDANNNLDVIRFQGRYYLGIRTAPNHFASKKAKLYLMSTEDFEEWRFEKEVALRCDVREPRFYALGDTLFFMFFKGGRNMFRFQPNGIFQTHLHAGTWSDLRELDLPLGYVPWRTKVHDGQMYLSTYSGMNEYNGKPCETRMYLSRNGYDWQPMQGQPQLSHPRALAENEFVFMPDGDLWGISRLELDGSNIFHAKKDALHQWETWFSPHKFDSPLMFQHKGIPYLIARRNLDGDGTYFRKPKHPKRNLIRYSLTRKTTALYALDTAAKALIHLQDLPSTGDCAFPGIAQVNDSTYHVFNYSSNIHRKPKSWIRGQLGKTYIYRSTLIIKDCKVAQFDRGTVYPFEGRGKE